MLTKAIENDCSMEKMNAVICTGYGEPDVLKVASLEKPVPNDNALLVKIVATSVTASDTNIRSLTVPGGHKFPMKHLLKFAMRLFLGIRKPRNPVLGLVFS